MTKILYPVFLGTIFPPFHENKFRYHLEMSILLLMNSVNTKDLSR